eukprot:1173688-Prorocentrum_minimum.AAC.2
MLHHPAWHRLIHRPQQPILRRHLAAAHWRTPHTTHSTVRYQTESSNEAFRLETAIGGRDGLNKFGCSDLVDIGGGLEGV